MSTQKRVINETEEYIESHLMNWISLSDIAFHAGMSKYHFHRIFRKYSHETIHRFISRIKLERSAMLLITNPGISVTDIAFRYGYSESSAYCRAFKKHYLVSPSVFRSARNVKNQAGTL